MKQQHQQRFISESLIFAAELAYVEAASGTVRILQDTLKVFRYTTSPERMIEVRQEVEMIHSYLSIQEMQYPHRLTINLPGKNELPDLYIQKASVLNTIDELIQDSRISGTVECSVNLDLRHTDLLFLRFKTGVNQHESTWKLKP